MADGRDRNKPSFPGGAVQSIKTLPGVAGALPQFGQRIAQRVTPGFQSFAPNQLSDLVGRYPQLPGSRLPNLVQPLGLSPYAPAQKPGLAPDQVGAAVGAALDRLKASSAGQGQSPQQALQQFGNSLWSTE